MRIQGYSYEQVTVEDVQTHLYPHQAAMYNEWKNHTGFLLVTKTGSGKTRATALPVLRNHESAVFVYPHKRADSRPIPGDSAIDD